MDFFQTQDDARRRTRWLVVYFVLSVVGVVVAVDLLLFLVLGSQGMKGPEMLGALAGGAAVAGGVILVGSMFKSVALRRGGAVVASDLGGRLVLPDSRESDERRLLNVVEEMAIASGTPVPQVYLLDDEPGINAFAAGTEPSNAVIGVTRGCVQRLSRAELQGVVAHEFSHILNGDMRLNMRLIGMVFGLILITLMGRMILNVFSHTRISSNRKEGAGIVLVLMVLGLGLLVIGSIGTLFARLLQAAVSRQREYLADASAVQFTREPEGIAGALKKIGGQQFGSKVENPKAMEASHLFFADGGLFAFGFATHPPLEERIRLIESGWDGEFVDSALPPLRRRAVDGPPPVPSGGGAANIAAVAMLERGAGPRRTNLAAGRWVRDGLRPEWLEAAHDREEAQALVFGLLLAEDDRLRRGELDFLETTAGRVAAELAVRWVDELRGLHSARKIALVDVCMPTLRGLSVPEYERFSGMIRWLIVSDAQVTLFEFMLQHVVQRHLAVHFEQRGFPPMRYHRMVELGNEANVLLSAIARLERGEAEAEVAWAMVREEWGLAEQWSPRLLPTGECGPEQLETALERFDEAAPIVKKQLLRLCGLLVAEDGVLTSRESELLRATADAIGCGIPPFVEDLLLDAM